MRLLEGDLRRTAPPIAVQILALLVGGLVVAQVSTLALSLLLPPPPQPQYRLRDIAAALRGGPLRADGLPPLERTVQPRPPNAHSPGWQVSEPARRDLATAMGVERDDVELLFYSPPPFAGAETRDRRADQDRLEPRIVQANLFAPLMMGPPGGGGPGPFGTVGPAGPTGGPGAPSGGRGPGGRSGGGSPSGGGRTASPGGAAGVQAGRPQVFDPIIAPAAHGAPDGGPGAVALGRAAPGGGVSGLGVPGASVGRPPSPDEPIQTAPAMGPGPAIGVERQEVETGGPSSPALQTAAELGERGLAQVIDPPIHVPRTVAAPTARAGTQEPVMGSPPAVGPAEAVMSVAPVTAPPVAAETDDSSAQPLAAPVARTLFGLARTPMVDGEFLAALRLGPGRWVTVRPLQDPILNRWQRRVALWFLISFAAVAPVGYLVSRRLAAPLTALADTADRLGRDASTPVHAAAGASEIGRLALAFSAMQGRLQRHVQDRTAMVGAISHDLRTPLARLRFKLERAPPSLRSSMLRDLIQMEEMLDSVLLFIRDASEPGLREMTDLRSIVECVVDDAALLGGDVTLEPGRDAAVEVDILGVQRVVSNLVENALKYGDRAQVSLHLVDGDAVLDVADAGPGLPQAELEKVFQPFYRSPEGRQASAKGIGLGLSVSRSIARAHGGDILLSNGQAGLVATLRLPLSVRVAASAAARSETLCPAA